MAARKRNKFRAVKTTVDGVAYASKFEAKVAAELEAKDARIADLEAARAADACVLLADVNARDRRIRELEAELAKRELPSLPESVRAVVDTLRQSHITQAQAVTLTVFLDATFPKPVPQWELDARAIERLATVGGDVKDINLGAIAKRIREAHREAK